VALVVRSYCRICAPNCGVLVTVEDDVVTAVRGDPDHPVSLSGMITQTAVPVTIEPVGP
jgi:assimilatory nitrate reductase catalytic subunit